jgi:hypothetical protein
LPCRRNAGRRSSTRRLGESSASPCPMSRPHCQASCSGPIPQVRKGRRSS